MRQQIRSQPVTIGLLLVGGFLLIAAVYGAYELILTGKWLGAYLFLAIIGGIGIGSIGLGLFAYVFNLQVY